MSTLPWAISKLQMAQQCPRRFVWRYVERRPSTGGELPTRQESSDALVGIAVHRALELALGGMSVDAAFEKAAAESAHLTRNERDGVLHFTQQVADFVGRMRRLRLKHGAPESAVHNEKKLAITADGAPAPFQVATPAEGPGISDAWFRGVVDYLLLLPDGTALIFDHKTGAIQPAETHAAQCRGYCVLVAANFPTVRRFQTFINFVMDGRRVPNITCSRNDVVNTLLPELRKMVHEAEKTLEPIPRATPGKHCRRCEFVATCEAAL